MDKHKLAEGIIASIIMLLFMLCAAYFFSQTNIHFKSFMTIVPLGLLNAITSIEFILFAVCCAASLGFALLIARKQEYFPAISIIIVTYCIACIISLLAFNLLEYVIPILFGLIAFPIGLMFLQEKEKELKYLQKFRSGSSAVGKISLIISIGLFVALLIAGYSSHTQLKETLVQDVLSLTIGDGIKLEDMFIELLVGQTINSQVQTIDTIIKIPEIDKLKAKNDPDGILLAQKLQTMKEVFQSDSMRKQIMAALKNSKIDPGKEVLPQMPIIGQLAEYSWIVYAISGFITVSLIGGMVIANLAGIIYAGLIALFPKKTEAQKTEEKPKQ